MKLIFNHEGKPIEKLYPHKTAINFPDFTKGVLLLGKPYKTLESWLEALRTTLLPLGISDFQYRYPTPTKDATQLKMEFFFRDEVQLLQFSTIALGDIKGTFTRIISSQDVARARQRRHNVENFIGSNDITATIIQTDAFTFKIVTNSRFHDHAIAIHQANGTFDEGVQDALQSGTPRLLARH